MLYFCGSTKNGGCCGHLLHRLLFILPTSSSNVEEIVLSATSKMTMELFELVITKTNKNVHIIGFNTDTIAIPLNSYYPCCLYMVYFSKTSPMCVACRPSLIKLKSVQLNLPLSGSIASGSYCWRKFL